MADPITNGLTLRQNACEFDGKPLVATRELNEPNWGSDWELLPEEYLTAECPYCGNVVDLNLKYT